MAEVKKEVKETPKTEKVEKTVETKATAKPVEAKPKATAKPVEAKATETKTTEEKAKESTAKPKTVETKPKATDAKSKKSETETKPVKKAPAKKAKPAEEKVHTFPLRKAKDVPMNKRARKAVKIIRELAARHTKTPIEQVNISTELNAEIWKRGARKPPSKITVKTSKTDEKVTVNLLKK